MTKAEPSTGIIRQNRIYVKFLSQNCLHKEKACHLHPPAIPMKNRRITNPDAVWTSPVRAVGIDAEHRTIKYRILAPYLSHKGPRRNLTAIVDPTPTMEEVQICCLVRFKSAWISGSRGVMANQTKKAQKKLHQQQWKALM